MNVLIVDDEAPARDRLRRLLGELDGVEVSGEAANGTAAIEHCSAHPVDIVLLDIRMPGMDGLEAALHLAKLADPPAIVFTTAYEQYAIEAFETEAVGYLVKPVRAERLARAIEKAGRVSGQRLASAVERAQSDTARPRHAVCARIGDSLRLIALADVRYFEADQKYVRVWHSDGDHLIDDPLKSLESEFEQQFVRIHRKTLVAIDAIEALEKSLSGGFKLRLKGIDRALPVSRRHVGTLKERITGANQ